MLCVYYFVKTTMLVVMVMLMVLTMVMLMVLTMLMLMVMTMVMVKKEKLEVQTKTMYLNVCRG